MTSVGSFITLTNQQNRLYLNNGDETFTDISAAAGVDTARGGCVAAFLDHDRDGLEDLFVGNCNQIDLNPAPYELWINNGDLTFTDVGPAAGSLADDAYPMSAAVGDFDNDGLEDIFCTNFGPTHSVGLPPGVGFRARPHWPSQLHRNNGDGTYSDHGTSSGLGIDSEFGWGASFADLNNDGHQDLIATGSLPLPPFQMAGPGLANPGSLYHNHGDGTFSRTQTFGLEFKFTTGLAVADYDGDGYPDVAIGATNLGVFGAPVPPFDGRPTLLRNTGGDNSWITVRAVGRRSNRGGVGARVTALALVVEGPEVALLRQTKVVRAGSSFISSESPWLTFGLGPRHPWGGSKLVLLRVEWPAGGTDLYLRRADRTVTLVERRRR